MTEQSELTETKDKNGRSSFLLIGGAILLGLAAALLIFGSDLFSQNDSILEQVPAGSGAATVAQVVSENDGVLMAGDTAHNFFLQDLAGNTVSLEEFRGRPVIINFWATWCTPCRLEMPTLQQAQDQYQDEGLMVLALNDQETENDVEIFVAEVNEDNDIDLSMTMLLDPDGVISGLYKVFNFPTTYFVDGDGVITAVHRGLLTESQIEEYLSNTIPQD